MRRFQLKRDGDACADGVEFEDEQYAVQWLENPRRVTIYLDREELLLDLKSRYELTYLDGPTTTFIDADCGCDFVQTLGGNGHTVEIHHQFPDDGAPHVESLECACQPALHVQLPDVIVADHADQDQPQQAGLAGQAPTMPDLPV